MKKEQKLDKDYSKQDKDLSLEFLQKFVGCMEKQAFVNWRNYCKIPLTFLRLQLGEIGPLDIYFS